MTPMFDFLKQFIAPERQEEAIVFAEIAITDACNLQCAHCSRLTLERRHQELTEEVLVKFLAEFRDQGGRMACFTGGEPLAKKKILYPAVAHAAAIGIAPSIISNGLLLDKAAIGALRERGIAAVGISLNGGEEYHDAFVAKKGAYRDSVDAIENAKAAGIACTLMTVPTDRSMGDGNFDHVLELGRRLDVPVYINFPTYCGSVAGHADMLLSRENLDKLYRMGREGLIRKDVFKKDKSAFCPAVLYQIYISAYGDVCPCPFIQLSFGNIFETSLAGIQENFRKSGYLSKTYRCCPPAESEEFIETVAKPIYAGGPVPLHFSKHPAFAGKK